MNIQHEIVSFDPVTGSILVKYSCDQVTESLSFNIDIPIENGVLASIETIDFLIELHKPVKQFERVIALKTIQLPAYLVDKIPPPVVVEESSAVQE